MYVMTAEDDGIKILKVSDDPNKEMIEADGKPLFNEDLEWAPEEDGILIEVPLTPLDTIENIGRALTKTAGFPEKLGCYEHVKGNMDD